MSIWYATENQSPYMCHTTLVQFRPLQQIMVSTMQSITAVCLVAPFVHRRFSCTDCHIISLICLCNGFATFRGAMRGTNFVGQILMFSAASQSQRPELLALLALLSCNQTRAAKISGRLRHPNMHHVIVTTCSGRFPEIPNFPGTCPEFLQNFPGNSGISPRNFRNPPGISGTLGSARSSRPSQFPNLLSELAGNFRNLPGISGIFPELFRNFPGTFPELSRNFPGTFPGPVPETPEDLLGFLPKSVKNVTRAEPTQIF